MGMARSKDKSMVIAVIAWLFLSSSHEPPKSLDILMFVSGKTADNTVT